MDKNKNFNCEFKLKGSLHYSDVIRCRYMVDSFDGDNYQREEIIIFDNWESCCLWLKNQFFDNRILSVKIDLIDSFDISDNFVSYE